MSTAGCGHWTSLLDPDQAHRLTTHLVLRVSKDQDVPTRQRETTHKALPTSACPSTPFAPTFGAAPNSSRLCATTRGARVNGPISPEVRGALTRATVVAPAPKQDLPATPPRPGRNRWIF